VIDEIGKSKILLVLRVNGNEFRIKFAFVLTFRWDPNPVLGTRQSGSNKTEDSDPSVGGNQTPQTLNVRGFLTKVWGFLGASLAMLAHPGGSP